MSVSSKENRYFELIDLHRQRELVTLSLGSARISQSVMYTVTMLQHAQI